MADSDPAVLAEIARAINDHKHDATYPPTGRGRGRGRGRGHASYKNATWVAPTTRAATTTSATIPAAPTPEPRQVTIDGVVFVAHPRGNKLVRKPGTPGAPSPAAGQDATPAPSAGPSTPRRLSHLGTTYIRTKTGNLVSLACARKQKQVADARRAHMDQKRDRLDQLVGVVKTVQGARNNTAARGGRRGGYGGKGGPPSRRPPKPKSDKLCRFFQRTGQCSRAHTCPYVHDSHKIAICPLFLRSACPRPASQCPLSHSPNAHRSPHCVHFPHCTRASGACPYAHVKVSADAVPCREFVEVGWCERGEECDKRHVRECWRFAETGKCEKVGCREPHVLRRTHTASEEEEEEEEDQEDDEEEEEDDDDEAINELIEDAVEMNEAERVFGDGSSAITDPKGKKKRSRRDSDAPGLVGISGAAGRQLKRLKGQEDEDDDDEAAAAARRRRGKRVFAGQDDFVTLEMPLSSDEDEDEDEEEASSVDSEDLAAEEEAEAEAEAEVEEEDDDDDKVADEQQQPLPPADTAAAATATATALTQPGSARPRATDLLDQDALDYGDDDDDDDD